MLHKELVCRAQGEVCLFGRKCLFLGAEPGERPDGDELETDREAGARDAEVMESRSNKKLC